MTSGINIDATSTASANSFSDISVGSGFGTRTNAWQLYFTNPDNTQDPNRLIDTSKLINTTIVPIRGVSLYKEPNQDSSILKRVSIDENFLIRTASKDKLWLSVQLQDKTEGWMLTEDVLLASPTPNATDTSNQYGINIRLVDAIGRVRNTLDIAAYTLDEKEITKTILEVYKNGVKVRIVTDDINGLDNPQNTFQQFMDAGIQVVTDERPALMHNNFMILDGKTVWTGSWTYTEKGTYKSNDNALSFDSAELAAIYQHEFNQMFENKEFSPRAPSNPINMATVSGIPVAVYFSPHENVEEYISAVIGTAQKSINFMTFSFTDNSIASYILDSQNKGVSVKGIFEKTESSSDFSELKSLYCAHADTRIDGSIYSLHQNVIIVDESIVITGSAIYSPGATNNNNENTIVIEDPVLASAYIKEFERKWSIAQTPTNIICP